MAFKKVPVTFITVSLQVEGIHNWPDAEAIHEEVGFLSFPHRHQFHIKATKRVNHDDRDVEIILFKREIVDYLKRNFFKQAGNDKYVGSIDFGSRSCEMIAKDLCEAFDLRSCEVLEDGENGAIVEIQSHFIQDQTISSNNEVMLFSNGDKIIRERDTFDDSHLNQQ